MLIIPAIDLLDGKAVRLLRGDYEQVTIFGDPFDFLAQWRDQGADLIHVVDLAGARAGTSAQGETIAALCATGMPLQVGGGLRTLAALDRVFNAGAERAVLGTAAVADQSMVEQALSRWADRIVVAIDAREGFVAMKGWTETSSISAVDLAEQLAAMGVARFLVTDIARDGAMTEPNYELLARVQERSGRPVIASGGVASLEAIRTLAAAGLESAVVGRALYEGTFDLRRAQEAAHAG